MNNRRVIILIPFIVFVAFLIALMIIIPPFQTADEDDHFKRAYMLSTGDLMLASPAGKSSGGYIDKGLISLLDLYKNFHFKPWLKVTSELEVKKHIPQWSSE